MRKRNREFLIRANRNTRLIEANVRNRRRIDKRKYFGVGKQIKNYTNYLRNNLFDKDLFNELMSKAVNITSSFEDYLSQLSVKLENLDEDIAEFFNVSFEKGTKRVQNKNGDPISFAPDVIDFEALEQIKSDQLKYIKNITTQQRNIVQKELTGAIEQGTSVDELANNLQKKIGNFTKARATTIARTELVKSHNLGQVETMRALGVETYIYWTTGDKKVSDICNSNQGPRSNPNVYDLSLSGTPNNPLPVINSHPQCRCTILVNE